MMPKTALHKLTDIAVEAASLLETSNDLEKAACATTSAQALLAAIALLILRLRQWHATSGLDIPARPPMMVPASSSMKPINLSLQPHWYPSKFHDGVAKITMLQQARGMLFYWALELCLLNCVFSNANIFEQYHRVIRKLSDAKLSKATRDDICSSISAQNALSCADNITSWFKFAAQNTWQSFGPAFGVLTLQTAIDWYVFCSSPKNRRRLGGLGSNISESLSDCRLMLDNLVRLGSPLAGYRRLSATHMTANGSTKAGRRRL